MAEIQKLQLAPVQIEWKSIRYTVQVEDKAAVHSKIPCTDVPMMDKTILNCLSGFVAPGTMLAIMGPSGSGKTTLLNVLAGRINKKNWQGEVLINNNPADRSILKVVAGYVPQDDILYGSQTVYESLLFYAHLKLPHLTEEEKNRRVQSLIEELGLTKVSNSLVGFVGSDAAASGLQRGISGGERKRTSIGCQLIADPSLLFLDEPTTGLDSFAAEAIIRVLSRQIQAGRTVIFTIHQPSTDILKLFDQLLIIAFGRTIYFGPQEKTLKYYASVGYPCSADENPGDHFVEVIHREKGGKGKERDSDLEDSSDTNVDEKKEDLIIEPPSPQYVPSPPSKSALHKSKKTLAVSLPQEEEEKKPLAKDKKDDKGKEVSSGSDSHDKQSPQERVMELANKFQNSKYAKLSPPPVSRDAPLPPLRRASLKVQFRELVKRNVQQLIRDPAAAKAGLAQSTFISLVMGLIYLQLGHDQAAIQNRAGALFFGAIFLMFGGMMAPLSLFAIERKQFLFQYMEALYTPTVYYFSKILPELVPQVVNSLVFSILFYFMLGLRQGASYFFIFWGIAYALVCAAQAFAFFFSGLVPDTAVLMSIFPILFLPQMIFSGFYLNSATTPVYFIWVEYLSIIKYAFRALCKNEFSGAAFYCTAEDLVNNKGICPYTTGDQWLDFRDLNGMPIYGDALILVLFIFAYHCGGYYFTRKIALASAA